MRFLVDAQLPRRLALRLRDIGHDVVHTLELAEQNRTTDQQITEISVNEQRIVITKDADFVTAYLLTGRPYKLLLVSTGNITNADLEALVVPAIPAIVAAFEQHSYLELSRTALIIHS